ncbi:Beta-amyloid-like protein, partial [Dinothrombium tinctorium]
MLILNVAIIISVPVLSFEAEASEICSKALAANIDTGLSHFQPMVALLCGQGKYHNQYLDENKQWVSDADPRATCITDKLEILEYCRK